MNQLYKSDNQLNLSQLTDCYDLPSKYKSRLAKSFKYVYESVCHNYRDTHAYKQSVVSSLNKLAYIILKDDVLPITWLIDHPLENLPEISENELQEVLKEYYLTPDSICWDINTDNMYYPETIEAINEANENIKEQRQRELSADHQVKFVSQAFNRPLSSRNSSLIDEVSNNPLSLQSSDQVDMNSAYKSTSFDDLLLEQGLPYIPRFDSSKIWLNAIDEKGEQFIIYKSIPEIPQRQCQITVSTESYQLIPSELMQLFPNKVMRMRHHSMYEHYDNYPELEYDEDLGVIFPVSGFTKQQVIDNIIKYPDIINISPGRIGRNTRALSSDDPLVWVPFETFIEIDGELTKVTASLWNELPELNCLPYTLAFKQEYVIRKYLLERDNGVRHNKELFGTLYPFITLFMPIKKYIERGYTDIDNIVMKCVKSRVSYHRSRNPILLRLGLHYNYEGELLK